MATIPINQDKATFINCTFNYENGEGFISDKPLRIVADDGFEFVGVYRFSIKEGFVTKNKTFINNGNELVYNAPFADNTKLITLNTTFETIQTKVLDPEPELVNITFPSYSGVNNYKDLLASGFVTVKINGQEVAYGESVPVTKFGEFTIEIINNQLYQQFDYDTIKFSANLYNRDGGGFMDFTYDPDEKTADKILYNINAENWTSTIGTGNLTTYKPNALVYLAFKDKEVEYIENYPFLNIYKVDDDSLNTLSKEVNERRYKKDYGSDGSIIKDYDVTGNMLDLVRVPYAIVTEPELEPINLNNDAMESQGYKISKYIQEIHLGKIYCTHESLANIGYKNIEFNLFVPNFKPIPLDVSKVINRTIEMKMNLDLTTGYGTLNLLMEGIAFHVEQEKITKDILFKTDNNRLSLEDNVLNTKYLNPYLEIIVLDPDNTINSQELKQRKINKSSLLYVKSDNIILNSKATYNEQLEIEMLVRKGVYING